MRPFVLALALALLWAGACSDNHAGSADAAPCAYDGGGAFGAPCAAACDCLSRICFKFGDGTQACVQACTSNDQCPSGSQGQKCNGQGVCRP